MGRWLVQESLLRFDERETAWDYIARHIWVGRDDTEAIALIVSPICMLYLLNRFCNKNATRPRKMKFQASSTQAKDT